MEKNYINILFFIFIFILLFFLKKLRPGMILPNNYGLKHQTFVNNSKVPLLGGVFLVLFMSFFLSYQNLLFYLISTSFFLLGFLADTNNLKSPYKRIIIQIIFITVYLFLSKTFLLSTKLEFLDILLKNKIFNYSFLIFCILIIVNGTNFIDGLNGLAVGYYFIISIIIFNLNLHFYFFDSHQFILLILLLLILFILNLNNKIFLGDSGSNFLGLFYSILLINIYNSNYGISPFFIILLLWYPAFENLFSIFRKTNFSKSPLEADTGHFHHLLFSLFKKKNKWSSLKANNMSSFLINFYNCLVLYFGSLNIFSGRLQLILIVINILVYTTIYSKLLIYSLNNKK
jgi:UDP-N-acetylmuramyl pentapeptide phosphotransferase/UDP-N-acetylglucosamine-1-phosphate transferase